MNNPERGNWQEHYEQLKNRPPRPSLVKAVSLMDSRGEALDLGASALNDTKYLLEQGFKHVTALDKESVADEMIATLPKDKVSYVITTFEDFEFPKNTYDIINAQYSLPFNPKGTFLEVFSKIKNSLKPNGVFVGQLFGEKDEWNTEGRGMTFQTKADVENLLADMEIIDLTEEEKDSKPFVGDIKHWHIFHIMARKITD